MRKLFVFLLLTALGLVVWGCGGQLGRNSPIQVRIEGNPSGGSGGPDFADMHVIISPLSGSALSLQAVSDTQNQSWATYSSGAGFKELDFTTTSQQVPYFVYLRNSGSVDQETRLRIFVDGNERDNRVINVAAGATVQVSTVFRNNIEP